VYYNLSSAGAYAGPRKIYEILGQNHENAHSLYKIRQWLQSKVNYTLLKAVRRKIESYSIIIVLKQKTKMFFMHLAFFFKYIIVYLKLPKENKTNCCFLLEKKVHCINVLYGYMLCYV
jgi:hypothetical protein